MSIAVHVGAEASATVTSQAAEKVYRSLGPSAVVETQLDVGERGRLGWLPQETILFNGARIERRLSAKIAHGGSLLACESLVFGRKARGETMAQGCVRDSWHIERGGRLAWIDRLGLSENIAARLDGMGFGGARALATVLYAADDAAELLPATRESLEEQSGGATLVNGILVARIMSAEPDLVRDGLARLVAVLRRAPAPRLWTQ